MWAGHVETRFKIVTSDFYFQIKYIYDQNCHIFWGEDKPTFGVVEKGGQKVKSGFGFGFL